MVAGCAGGTFRVELTVYAEQKRCRVCPGKYRLNNSTFSFISESDHGKGNTEGTPGRALGMLTVDPPGFCQEWF